MRLYDPKKRRYSRPDFIRVAPESRVYEILNRLVNMGFIEKIDDEYILPRDTPNRKGMLMASREVISQR